MKIRIILCFVAFLTLHDAVAQEDRRAKTTSTITEHIKTKMVGDGTYTSYSFGNLVRNEPKEFLELEELINVKKALPDMRKHYRAKEYDSVVVANNNAIQQKKREILDKNIRPDFQMTHSFMITNKESVNKVYKMDFYLDFDYKITDVHLVYTAILSKSQAEQYKYYEQRMPIFDGPDAYRNNYLSRQMYDQYEEGFIAAEYDIDILFAALRAVKVVRQEGELDVDKLGELAIEEWVEKNAGDISGYKPSETSYMYEINTENNGKKELIGYKMFHKYTYLTDEKERTEDVVYFEFDKLFVIRGVLRVPEPYDMYFQKN